LNCKNEINIKEANRNKVKSTLKHFSVHETDKETEGGRAFRGENGGTTSGTIKTQRSWGKIRGVGALARGWGCSWGLAATATATAAQRKRNNREEQ